MEATAPAMNWREDQERKAGPVDEPRWEPPTEAMKEARARLTNLWTTPAALPVKP